MTYNLNNLWRAIKRKPTRTIKVLKKSQRRKPTRIRKIKSAKETEDRNKATTDMGQGTGQDIIGIHHKAIEVILTLRNLIDY